MKKLITVLLVLALVSSALTVQAQKSKKEKKMDANMEAQWKAEQEKLQNEQRSVSQPQVGKAERRGFTNELNGFIAKDSAQFYMGGCADVHLNGGEGLYYDSAGTIVQLDHRVTIKAGQMGLYLKDRQRAPKVNNREAIWITFLAEDSSYVDVPFIAPTDNYNQVFELAGENIIRGARTALIVMMAVESKFSPVKDLIIHNPPHIGPANGPACPPVMPGLKLARN